MTKAWREHRKATKIPQHNEAIITGFQQQAESSCQIPIDPALLEIDALFPNGIDTVGNVQIAERILRNRQAGSE